MQNRFGPGCGCNAQLVGGGTCGRGGKMVGTLCDAHYRQAQTPHFVAGAGFQPIKERKAATKRKRDASGAATDTCNAQLVGGGTCGRGGKMVGTLCNAHNLQAQTPHFVAGAGFQPIKERKAATKRGQMRQALDASTTQRMAVRRALDNKGSRRLLGRKSELISGDALWRGGLSSPSPRRGETIMGKVLNKWNRWLHGSAVPEYIEYIEYIEAHVGWIDPAWKLNPQEFDQGPRFAVALIQKAMAIEFKQQSSSIWAQGFKDAAMMNVQQRLLVQDLQNSLESGATISHTSHFKRLQLPLSSSFSNTMLIECKAAAEALCVSGMVPNDQYCALTANGFNCDDIKIGPMHTSVTSRTGEPIRSVTAATPLQAVLRPTVDCLQCFGGPDGFVFKLVIYGCV